MVLYISTHLNKLADSFKKLKDLFESLGFHLYGTIVLAIAILLIKGSGGYANFFNTFAQRTIIVETSAYVLSQSKSNTEAYLADISSLAAWDNANSTGLIRSAQTDGQGGPGGSTLEPTTVQENSIFAHNPAAMDYADTVVSGKRTSVAEYTVQPGDSLSFIARDYGVSIESIMWANGLRDSNSIREGNILKIPPVSGVIHTIKSGETIGAIAKKYGANAENIITYNSLSQDGKLQINDELIIPDGKIATAGTPYTRTAISFAHLPNLDNFFAHPTNGLGRISQWLHGRNGIDVAAPYGSTIYAAADGTIVGTAVSGYNGGYGLFVKISHPNGTDTLYAHLSKVLVVTGQSVEKGQQIAKMGSTGRSTGSHLHFEVHGAKNPLSR
ncbi:MAG: peptidoglycan DD-metalloendopeptidase family protein [Candidatus Yanofskybacteria bacterium]|nr:peptidoglycan DD-metalloendopeptidase family protein [Candidatus Yanofskybacteria bacterium]